MSTTSRPISCAHCATSKLVDFGQMSDPGDFLNTGVQGPNDPFNELWMSSASTRHCRLKSSAANGSRDLSDAAIVERKADTRHFGGTLRVGQLLAIDFRDCRSPMATLDVQPQGVRPQGRAFVIRADGAPRGRMGQ
jgi:hypothetical protein